MRKILVGLVAAVIVCAGYLGFAFSVQRGVAGEIDGALARISAAGMTVTRGSVDFDPAARTLVITDIALTSDAQPSLGIKIGRLTASGVDATQAGRFAAERIEIVDVEASGTLPMPSGLKLVYKVPRITLAGYSGPAGPLRDLDPASPFDLWRDALEHFAAINADLITIPSITVSLAPDSANASKGVGPVEYTYSDTAIRDMRSGRIASMTAERLSFTARIAAPAGAESLTGEIAKLAILDLDADATLAILDPARAKDDTYHRAYRQITTGPYTMSMGAALKVQIDSVSADDIGVRPAKLQIGELMAALSSMQAPGATPSPAQVQQLMQKVGDLYAGIRLGKLEIRGASVTVPDGGVKIDAIRLVRLENGRIAELSLDGFDVNTPKTPGKVGRFALKGLDIAGLIRSAAQFSPGKTPTPEQLAPMLHLLEGVELKGLVSLDNTTGKPINVDALELSWGDYVGPLPSRLHASLKMSGPVKASDGDPFKSFAAAGFTSVGVSVDLGLGWTEATRTFALTPGTIALDRVGTLSARVALGNVTRDVFTVDPLELMVNAAVVEAGPAEFTLRDTGGIDIAIAQQARQQNVSRDTARQAILANIRQTATGMAVLNPDVTPVFDAFARFVEAPKGTLTIKLTPKGSVPLQEIIDAAKTNPLDALSRFRVEAVTGK